MQITGIEGMSVEDIERDVEHGGRFVLYSWTISVVVMTFKRASDIHYVRAGESRITRGLPCTLATLALGWWGFPWGPIYSFGSIFGNFGGGTDVTAEVLADLGVPNARQRATAKRRARASRGT